MQNDATTAIRKEDVKKFIDLSGHHAEIVDFSKIIDDAAAKPKEEEKKKQVEKPVEPEGH